MVPIRNALEKLATDLGKTYSDYKELCEDSDIVQVGIRLVCVELSIFFCLAQAVVKTLGIHGIKSNLEKFEIPRMVG